MTAFTYILRCSDDTFYTGSTVDISVREAQHNSPTGGAAYTRRRRPVTLVWYHESETIQEAWALERRIHGWSRAKKQALIDGRLTDLPGLSKKEFHRPGRMEV